MPTAFDPLPPIPTPRVLRPDFFLPWDLIHLVLSFFPFFLGGIHTIVPRADKQAIPSWSLWLERWFRVVHPETWLIFKGDDDADRDWLMQALQPRKQAIEEAAKPGAAHEWSKRVGEISKEFDLVVQRRVTRFTTLFGLFAVRQAYTARLRRVNPDWTEEDAIAAAPLGSLEHFPSFQEGSVWLFDVPAPQRGEQGPLALSSTPRLC